MERLKDGSMIVDASASLSDLTDVGMVFDEPDMEEHATLAGLVLSRLQRIPPAEENSWRTRAAGSPSLTWIKTG